MSSPLATESDNSNNSNKIVVALQFKCDDAWLIVDVGVDVGVAVGDMLLLLLMMVVLLVNTVGVHQDW